MSFNERVEINSDYQDWFREYSKPFNSMWTSISSNPELKTVSSLINDEIIVPIFV